MSGNVMEFHGALDGERDLGLRGCALSWNIVDLPSNTINYIVVC